MYFELSVPFTYDTKGKGKLPAVALPQSTIASLESRIDALVHLGYTVIAINHVVQSRFTIPAPLVGLRNRPDIVILRRITIVTDEQTEKNGGIGLLKNNTVALSSYDLIAIQPTSPSAFSSACLTHSVAGPLTAHIITLDLASQSRLPFYLKHTLVRQAIRNGAVFEIAYSPAIIGDESKKRHWWANAREVARVTKGKGILLSCGGLTVPEMRAPLDAANLATLLGIPQNLARDAVTTTPKSLVLRAQTRKTYRAILSEPTLVFPPGYAQPTLTPIDTALVIAANEDADHTILFDPATSTDDSKKSGKRPHDALDDSVTKVADQRDDKAQAGTEGEDGQGQRKKKKRKGAQAKA